MADPTVPVNATPAQGVQPASPYAPTGLTPASPYAPTGLTPSWPANAGAGGPPLGAPSGPFPPSINNPSSPSTFGAPAPSKRSSPWLWIALGCGGLMFLGVVLTGAGIVMYAVTRESASEAPAVLPSGFRRVAREEWSFGVPDQWQDISALLGSGYEVALNDPVPIGLFQTNINLVRQPYYGSMSSLVSTNRSELGALGISMIDDHSTTVGALEGWEFEYEMHTGILPMRFVQRVTQNDGQAYVLTCTMGKGAVDSQRTLCTSILDTLRVGGTDT